VKSQGFYLIACFILLTASLTACAPAATSTPTANPGSQANQIENTTTPVAASAGCNNAFFPVQSGNNWSYASTEGEKGDYTYIRTLSDVSSTGFTTTDQYSSGPI